MTAQFTDVTSNSFRSQTITHNLLPDFHQNHFHLGLTCHYTNATVHLSDQFNRFDLRESLHHDSNFKELNLNWQLDPRVLFKLFLHSSNTD